jgi:hypothetical protein
MIGKYSSTRLKKAYENTILSQVEVGARSPPASGRRRPYIVLVRWPAQRTIHQPQKTLGNGISRRVREDLTKAADRPTTR